MMSNYIEIYENALSDATSDFVISLFKDPNNKGYPGRVGTTKNSERTDSNKKDSTDLDLLHYGKENLPKELFQELENSLTKYVVKYATKYPLNHNHIGMEEEEIEATLWKNFSVYPYSVLCKKYEKGKGGYHAWHADRGYGSAAKHRHLVCMYYLNDVEEGGETAFYAQKLKIKPKKGSLVIFPATFTHIHKGHIPISNDKYIMNFWILQGRPIKGDLQKIRENYFLVESKNNKILNKEYVQL
jgi:hypothetical protein